MSKQTVLTSNSPESWYKGAYLDTLTGVNTKPIIPSLTGVSGVQQGEPPHPYKTK